MPSNVLTGFKPSNVTSDLLINNKNFAQDYNSFSTRMNSTLEQAFTEGATTLGANVATGLALTADAINGSPQDNQFFRSVAKSLLEAREDNNFHSGYDQAKVKKQLMDGDVLGAMDTIGFAGTVEEFVKSAPYMIGYAVNAPAMTAASSLSYAVENAQQKKEINKDTTPITANDLFTVENVTNAVAQGALDRLGFGAEKAGFKAARNVAVRQLITTNTEQGLNAVKKLGKATAMGLIGEGATEATQQYLQESYARDNYASVINDKEAQANILFAGTVGGLVGGNASLAGFGTDIIGSDVKSFVDQGKKDKAIRTEAVDAYTTLPEDIKSSVTEKEFVNTYKEEAVAEQSRSNASVVVDDTASSVSVQGVVDNKIAEYNPVTDTVEAVKEDGTKEAIEVKPEEKERMKVDAVYETIKDLDNESIVAQQEMWKALGFDTESDIAVSDVVGSKMAENTAKTNLEQIIESATPDTAQIINSKLMAEIAGASASKLEAMLNRGSMFAGSPEQRLQRITSKWEKNNLTPESNKMLLDFMSAEKEYAVKRLASLQSVMPKATKPVKPKAEPVKKQKASGEKVSAKANSVKPSSNADFNGFDSTVTYSKEEIKTIVEDMLINPSKYPDSASKSQFITNNVKPINEIAKDIKSSKKTDIIQSTQTLSTREDISSKPKLSDLVGSNKELSSIVNNLVGAAKNINTMFGFKYNPKFPEGISNDLVATNPIALFADGVFKNGDDRIFHFSDELVERIAVVGMSAIVSQSPVGSTDDSKSFVESFAGGKNQTYKEIIRYGGFGAQISVQSIGKAIASEAGIKISNDTNKLLADDAYAALGYAALFSAQQGGFVESKIVSNEDGLQFEMFKLTDKGREFNKHSKALKDYMKEHVHAVPTINPTEELPIDDKIRNSSVNTSNPMKTALKTHQSKKYKLNKEMFDLVEKFVVVNGKLNDDKIAEFIKQPSKEEIAKIHMTYREDYEAARQNAINEFKNSYYFFKSLSDGDVFSYKHFMSVSGRAMTDASGGGDFQNDKHFSRFVIDYIKPDNSTTYKVNNRNYNEYIFGVLQGFDGVLDYIKKPENNKFAENKKIFARLLNEMAPYSDEAVMKWATKKGIHAMRAARGFIQGRKHFNLKTGAMTGKAFESDLMFEVDGITNGLFHNILQSITSNFGSMSEAQAVIQNIFRRVGIYNEKDMNAQNLEKGFLDTYRTVAQKASDLLSSRSGLSVEVFNLLYKEIERSFAKSPTMIFQYGAGDFKIRRDVGESVLEELIEQLTIGKLVKDEDGTKRRVLLDPKKLNGIEELSFATRIAGKPNSDAISDMEYRNALKFLSEGVGDAFGEAMGKLFPTILSYNKNVYRIASSIRRLIANSDKFKKKIIELNSPKITVGRYKEVLKEIDRMFPKYNTGWSMHGDYSRNVQSHDLDTETTDSKREVKFYVNGKLTKRSYKVKTQKLEAGMPYLSDEYKAYDAGDKSRSVTMTHNIDGAIVNDPSIAGEYAGQVFDAIIGGVGMIDMATNGYNKAGFRINTQYSSLESILDSLKFMLSDKVAGENVYSSEFVKEAQDTIEYIESTIASNVELWESSVSSINSIGQMSGFDGGQYNVEDEVKAESIQKFKNRTRKYKKSVGSSSSSIPKHKTISESEFSHNEEDILNTFDELGQYEQPSNASTLRALLGSIVKNLGKPMSNVVQTLKISKNDVETLGEMIKSTGSIHISVSNSIKNRQYMTAQEVYSHELVHLASEYAFQNNPAILSQVRDLMLKAKKNIDALGGYEYFMEYMPDGRINAVISEEEEIKAAKEKYAYIFSNPNEFFTYGLTNAGFSELLGSMNEVPSKPDNMFDRLMYIWDIIVEFISNKLGTHVATTGDFKNQLNQLSAHVFALNASNAPKSAFQVASDFVESKMDAMDEKINASFGDVKSQFLKHSEPLARAVERLGRISAIRTIRENRFTRNVFNELVGGADKIKPILKLMRTKEVYQKIYNDTRHELSQHIKQRLAATDTQEVALQVALIDTDIQSLGLSASEVGELLISDTKLNGKIAELTKELEASAKSPEEKAYINYVVNQSNGLGYYLAKGIVAIKRGQMLNASNIVSAEYYNGASIKKTGIDIKTVDKLATLYAIKYTDGRSKGIVASYINSNETGVDEIMELMRNYNTKTAPELFKNEKHLMIKGYSQTALDRDTELEAVPYAKVKDYTFNGWSPVVEIKSAGSILMKRYNPEVKFTEGIMDTEQMARRGTMDTAYNPFDEEGKAVKDDMSFISNTRYGTLNAVAGQHTLPLLNRKEYGVISGYRYVANKKLRMEHLGQEFRISRVLPDTFAMTQRKVMGKTNNKMLAQLLISMMNNDMKKNQEDYVPIINNGNTAVMYRMIPDDMRKILNESLKGKDLYVHKDLLENVFGYKNMSVKNIEYIKSSDKMKWVLGLVEKVLQDLIGHIRKNVVFKTKEVVIDNIISNFITLVWRGMNPLKAIKYMDEGRILMNQYRKDISTIKRQEALLASKSKDYNKTLHEAAKKATEAKNGNPVSLLVKQGQFQSIIDDIDTEFDDNRNIVESLAGTLKDRLPKHLQFMIDILYVNENTRLYKFIMKVVQYSDFIARYAYYKFATQEKGMKPSEAIDEVEDMFVNYSLLQDRHLQYASDSGMFMFSKYFLRIQRMIARGFHKNPVRGASMLATQKMFGDTSDVSDSFIGTTNLFGRAGVDLTDVLSPHLPEWFL